MTWKYVHESLLQCDIDGAIAELQKMPKTPPVEAALSALLTPPSRAARNSHSNDELSPSHPPPGPRLTEMFGATLCTALHSLVVLGTLATTPPHPPWQNALPRTLLLHGPPGCGKTAFVAAACRSAGALLLPLHPSRLLSAWAGESERAVATAFENALARARCVDGNRAGPFVVVFFDEIDALGRERGGDSGLERRLLSELLLAMQKVLDSADHPGIAIIAATNRLQDVDAALQRRFDVVLEAPLPDTHTRAGILQRAHQRYSWAGVPRPSEEEYRLAAEALEGWSGAGVEGVVRRAAAGAVNVAVNEGREPRPPTLQEIMELVSNENRKHLGVELTS